MAKRGSEKRSRKRSSDEGFKRYMREDRGDESVRDMKEDEERQTPRRKRLPTFPFEPNLHITRKK